MVPARMIVAARSARSGDSSYRDPLARAIPATARPTNAATRTCERLRAV